MVTEGTTEHHLQQAPLVAYKFKGLLTIHMKYTRETKHSHM